MRSCTWWRRRSRRSGRSTSARRSKWKCRSACARRLLAHAGSWLRQRVPREREVACGESPSPSVGLRLGPVRRGSLDGTLSVRLAAPVRSAQSNEIRYSRLKTLKARDDAMQEVKKQALAKLPSLTSGAGYADLLESLILEVRLRLRGRLRDASRRDPSCRTQPLITLAETNSPSPSPSPSP